MTHLEALVVMLILLALASTYAAGYHHGKVDGWLQSAHPLHVPLSRWERWRLAWQRHHAGLPPE